MCALVNIWFTFKLLQLRLVTFGVGVRLLQCATMFVINEQQKFDNFDAANDCQQNDDFQVENIHLVILLKYDVVIHASSGVNVFVFNMTWTGSHFSNRWISIQIDAAKVLMQQFWPICWHLSSMLDWRKLNDGNKVYSTFFYSLPNDFFLMNCEIIKSNEYTTFSLDKQVKLNLFQIKMCL